MSATKFALGIRSCMAIVSAEVICFKYACAVKGLGRGSGHEAPRL